MSIRSVLAWCAMVPPMEHESPLPLPELPAAGRALALRFASAQIMETAGAPDGGAGVLVAPCGDLVITAGNRGYALRFDDPADPLRLALFLVALADRMAADQRSAMASADAGLARVLTNREEAGNG